MKLTYSVSRDDYKNIIAYTLREKAATFRSRLFLFLGTIGQMLLVLGLILFYPITTTQKLVIAALSILAAVRNYFANRAFSFRSSSLLSQMESGGQIHPDFWKEHTLETQEDGLLLIYGENDFLFPWINLASAVLDENYLYIKNHAAVVLEAVPRTALPGTQAEELLEILKAHQLETE